MTNASLQAMIDTFGERINMIILDNNVKLFVGYAGGRLNLADIQLLNFGDTDFLAVPIKDMDPVKAANGITAMLYYPTSCIQGVMVMDESAGDVLIDPWRLG